ncbi:MAG TPA: FAD:protein FMN transferase [Terriglobales bacterium]|nr:FAD:protein FMN transferase [Terriglobales bacterium]
MSPLQDWYAEYLAFEAVIPAMDQLKLFVQSRNAMGTVFSVYLFADNEIRAETAMATAFEEIERLDETLSNYRPSSELSRINRLAGREAVTTDPEVFSLLQTALTHSAHSGGAFDVTVGPLMRAWGFFRGQGRFPDSEELNSARDKTGFEKVKLDATKRTVRFAVPNMEIDLGAIGKGYAVDRAASVLRECAIDAALIDSGSSTMYAIGAPPGEEGWLVHVPDPRDRSRTVASLKLRDESISTSGNYEKLFELGGRKYCHVMDPRTGMPVEGVLQTTLVATDGTSTDALSNAMFVMGPEAARELLATVSNSRGIWFLNENQSQKVVKWNWQGPPSRAEAPASARKE